MSDRKAELDRKKARLAAMREEKRRKEEEKKLTDTNGAASQSTGDLRNETDEILKGLGISPASETPVSGASTPCGSALDAQLSPKILASPKHRQRKLQFGKVSQTNIDPKETVIYCKETQTQPAEHGGRDGRQWDYYVDSPRTLIGSPRFINLEWDDEFSTQMLTYDDAGREDDLETHAAALAEFQKMPIAPEEKKEEEPPKPRELSEEEKLNLMNTEEFSKFFDRSTRLMERAISEPEDIFTDYTGLDREDADDDLEGRQSLKMNREFFDDRWSRHRVVTALDWSTIFPELLVAAYNTNEESPHEPDGVCLVWNIKYKKNTPEYIFHCQSPVTSATFAKFHPNIVIGGTYSGQIVLWDNRTNKRTPVQRTPLSAAAHTHPVYSVTVAGTQNAHNLLSLSSDGKLCAWSLDMLAQPQESRELQHKQAKPVAATSFAFFANDVNNFVIGSEEGIVYSGCRHGTKAGLIEAFEAHQGPVTGLATHTTTGQVDFSHLFLTSSFDWTVMLWSAREQRPLYSFEDNSDYVYDTAWSPLHPAVFATVDGSGRLDVWDLNSDAEVPTARVVMDNQAALNKCRWHSSGLHIATGDDMGRVKLFDLNEQLATPRSDEWNQFAHTVNDLRSTSADQHEENQALR